MWSAIDNGNRTSFKLVQHILGTFLFLFCPDRQVECSLLSDVTVTQNSNLS
jgi:hypothetical protein